MTRDEAIGKLERQPVRRELRLKLSPDSYWKLGSIEGAEICVWPEDHRAPEKRLHRPLQLVITDGSMGLVGLLSGKKLRKLFERLRMEMRKEPTHGR